MSLFEDPRQLQCGHICCGTCLQSLIDMANEPGDVGILFGGKSLRKTITCPQCHEENQVPADGKFPRAFIVKNLVSHVKQAETESDKAEKLTKRKCSSCDKSVPYQELFYCLNCHEFDKENWTTDEELTISTLLKTKLTCPLCACKLHGGHKMAAANEALQAVMDKKKHILQADPNSVEQYKSTELQGKPSEIFEDSIKLAKAEELRLKGNEACRLRIFEEAIKFYTLSIREYASSICLSNRAQANINFGRFSVAYVDANEALRLDPNNEKAKWRRDKALECMGMARGMDTKKLQEKLPEIVKDGKTHQLWPKNLRISTILLMNEDFIDESMADFVPQNVICLETVGETVEKARVKNWPVPLRQLDLYLNDERVQHSIPILQVIFKFVKFDEQMVQMFRRIKPECFRKVDTGGVRNPGNQWLNCDFSQLSEASFRFLFDSHLFVSINQMCISEWTGMPAGYNYNCLFKLKAFKDAVEVDFEIGDNDFNMHLDKDVLIDFLHSPGFRSLKLNDGQLHEGFDAFLESLIERFQQDSESRFYEVDVILLNITAKTKRGLELDKPLTLVNSKTNDRLVLGWNKPVARGTYNTDNLFEFHAHCLRNQADVDATLLYHSNPRGPMTMRVTNKVMGKEDI